MDFGHYMWRIVTFYRAMHYSAKCGIATACRLSVCPSVTLVDQDHIDWKPSKLIARTHSPISLLFVAQRPSTYSQANMGKCRPLKHWLQAVNRRFLKQRTHLWRGGRRLYCVLGTCWLYNDICPHRQHVPVVPGDSTRWRVIWWQWIVSRRWYDGRRKSTELNSRPTKLPGHMST